MKSFQPLLDFMLYVALPCIFGFRSASYWTLVRTIAILCLAALIPQMLLDRYYDSVIPGIGYLLVGIPALLIASLCFFLRKFFKRNDAKS